MESSRDAFNRETKLGFLKMSKISPVSYKTLSRVFKLAGFNFIRQKGDHLIYAKKGIFRPIIIPMYDEIPVFIIKNNLRSGKISRNKYFKLLRRM